MFISHASEDKDTFVRPLATALHSLGVSVWYDEFSLKLGESLSRSIDHGLAQSSYGLVVISPAFIRKPWPGHELRGLVAREIDEDKVIIPVWHGVTRSEVLAFSPPLCDKVAVKTVGLNAKERPCPSDPDFPTFDEYELRFQHSATETHFRWQCYGLPKARMAPRVSLPLGLGRTKEEAERFVREHHDRYGHRYDA